jgi:Zn-dependent protease
MKPWRLFKIFGIEIRIHPSFFVLPLFFSYIYGKDLGFDTGVRVFVLVCLIFFCVLGHELTHSIRAKALGIPVPFVTLYPIGGIASMKRIPEKPIDEITVSIVGPLFNFVLAAALYFPLIYWMGKERLFAPSFADWEGVMANLFWANPVLGCFNLIPAFPMDGGRILRAALTKPLGRWKATRFSAMLGQVFAIIFVLTAVFTRNWVLIFVGAFVFASARRELEYLNYESR